MYYVYQSTAVFVCITSAYYPSYLIISLQGNVAKPQHQGEHLLLQKCSKRANIQRCAALHEANGGHIAQKHLKTNHIL